MKIFALELNNDIKGLKERKQYIESLISKLPSPDLVLLPELSISSYMPNQKIWEYADYSSKDTSAWAIKIAEKFNIFIGVGYVDYEDGNYYNRYLIADKKQVYGIVTKSEGEAAVFKRGKYNNIIKTPFGNVGVAICYDSRRKHFYENIKDEKISLIVFPHGSPADPKKDFEETKTNDYFCNLYKDAFQVPVIYVNSVGKLEYMPGIMGKLMKKSKFTMNGKTKIYTIEGNLIYADLDIKVKSTLGIAKVDVELKGNYKYDLTIMFGPDFKLDEIFGNPEQFDFSEIVNEPNFKETLDKMLEFTGLRFYERGSEFKIQLLLNKEIIEENQELIANSDMSSFIDEFLVNEENNIELVFVLKNNKISEVGFKAKVFVEEGDFEISYSAKSKVKMPKFPSFDDYEDFDIDSILSPFI